MINEYVHKNFNLLVREIIRIRDEYNSQGHRDKNIREQSLKELDTLKETITNIQKLWTK